MDAVLNRDTFLRRLADLCKEHDIQIERDDFVRPGSLPEFVFKGEGIWIEMNDVEKAVNAR